MRIVYYTHPAFFEVALPAVRELSRSARVDLLLEISPTGWQSAAFDLARRALPPGLVPADPVLAPAFPSRVRDCWRAADSFHLVVHPSRRSVHPASWRVGREVLRFAYAREADVLHIDDVDVSPRLALALPGGWRPRVIIAVHDPEPHTGERDWRKRLARQLAYPAADAFVLFSGAFRDRFVARYRVPPHAVAVTRLGVYDVFRAWAREAGHAPQGPPTVLFFGRLSPYKGLDVFYQAAPVIAALVPGVRIIVAGRPIAGYAPPAPPPLGGGATVEVVQRYLSNADTAELFGRATVAVCPYVDATQSGVVLTAYAFGVPVVATRVGGLPEYVRHERTGLLVDAGDPRGLADAVSRVLLDASLRGRLRAGVAAAETEFLSWRDTAAALLRIYGGPLAF